MTNRCKLTVLLASLAIWLVVPVSGARAEIVLFTHGSRLHVEAYQVQGERLRLELPSGGVLQVPLVSVERILDDTVSTRRVPAPPPVPVFQVVFDPEQPVPAVPFGETIHRVAARHGLNPALLAAVVRAESAFDPRAVSAKGAQGLMQLMPATARRFGVPEDAVFDPESNLDAGARYLRWLVDRFAGELPNVLAAYNAGEGTIERYAGVPPYRETRNYLRRIYEDLGLDADPLGDVGR